MTNFLRKLQLEGKLSYCPYTVIFTLIVLSPIIILPFYNDPSLSTGTNMAQNGYLRCKCVIFRVDDIGDFGKNKVQSAILDHFITDNKKLSVGIVVNRFGNLGSDGIVYTKVKEGYEKGLFELAIHGLNHLNYSGLTEKQQNEDFIEANNKLQLLFGNKSRIFIPPFNQFSSDTLKAMAESGLDIFSTSYWEESKTPNPHRVPTSFKTNGSKLQLSEVNVNETDSTQTLKKKIYHVPFDTSLLYFLREGYSGENITQKILSNVNKNIAKYGFSVIVLHPTDFATFNSSTGNYTNAIDPVKFQMLDNIIDSLEARGISIVDYSDVTHTSLAEKIPNIQQEQRQTHFKDTDINLQANVEGISFPTNIALLTDNNFLQKERFRS